NGSVVTRRDPVRVAMGSSSCCDGIQLLSTASPTDRNRQRIEPVNRLRHFKRQPADILLRETVVSRCPIRQRIRQPPTSNGAKASTGDAIDDEVSKAGVECTDAYPGARGLPGYAVTPSASRGCVGSIRTPGPIVEDTTRDSIYLPLALEGFAFSTSS